MFMRGLAREGAQRQNERTDEGKRIRMAKLAVEPELESIPPLLVYRLVRASPIKTVKPPRTLA